MNRQYGLDFARLLAAYCVAFGHLAFGGTFAVDEAYQRWTLRGEALPLLSKDKQNLWSYDYSLLVNWQTSTGIIGVGLFFIISGWVVPPMLVKYTSAQFLVNRALRIFPMLVIAVLIAAAIQYCFASSETFSAPAVLSTMFLLNDFTECPFTLGVVWTLVIEFKFYLLLAFFGKLTHTKIYSIVACVAVLCAVYYGLLRLGVPASNSQMQLFSNGVIRDLHYVVLMLISASLYIAMNDTQSKSHWRYAHPLIMVMAFNLIRFAVVKELDIRPWQDMNVISQVIIFLFFLGCLAVQRFGSNSTLARTISYASDVTYSLYLLHLSIGIFLLSMLRDKFANQYLLVFLVMLIISGLSLVCYHGIEKRCRYRRPNPSPSL